MQISLSKIIAAAIASAYVLAMLFSAGGPTVEVAKGSIALLLPMALIWFPEELGSLTGSVGRGGYISSGTPASLLAAMGWLLLVGAPVVLYCLR
jgi:hypothetical protein